MARRPREVEPGGIYHLGSRGNNRQPLYWSDDDRSEFLRILAEVARRWEWNSTPERWCWSGHRACAGLDEAPAFLAVDYVLRLFGNRRAEARLAYRRYVSEEQSLVSNGQSPVSDAGFRSG